MRLFAETLYARYAQALGRDEPVPEEGYQGAYMVEMGAELAAQQGARFLEMPRDAGRRRRSATGAGNGRAEQPSRRPGVDGHPLRPLVLRASLYTRWAVRARS